MFRRQLVNFSLYSTVRGGYTKALKVEIRMEWWGEGETSQQPPPLMPNVCVGYEEGEGANSQRLMDPL